MRGHQANEHIKSGASLTMNVRAEADVAFMREFERDDSQRYDRLMKSIQTAAIRSNRTIVHRSHQAASMRSKTAEQANVPEAAYGRKAPKSILKKRT
jgi:hypothetical protein